MPLATEESKIVFSPADFLKVYAEYLLSDFRQGELNQKLGSMMQVFDSLSDLRDYFRHRILGIASIKGWIALKRMDLLDYDGRPIVTICPGDVLIQEPQWDRERIITHSPGREYMTGAILSYRYPHSNNWDTRGVFVPISDPDILERAILLRLEEQSKTVLDSFEEAKKIWLG